MSKTEKILRVAAYCRVSTNEKEQLSSYENQIAYYTDYIASNPSWHMVGIFADKGLSGTQTKNRTSFNKMIKLCKKAILTLSSSKASAVLPETQSTAFSMSASLKAWAFP